MQVNVPCIALIEDIDNVFHGRENVARKQRHDVVHDARRERGTTTRQQSAAVDAADVRLPAELPGRRGAGRRHLHDHHDQRHRQDRPGPGPAAQAAGRHGRVHLHPARPHRQGRRADLHGAGGQEAAWPDASWATTRTSTARCWSSSTAIPELQETPAQFQERCGQVALACFWKEKEGIVAAPRKAPAEPLVGKSSTLLAQECSCRRFGTCLCNPGQN